MAAVKYNARDVQFEVSSDGGTTWVAIGGLDKFSVTHSQQETETTDFASAGEYEGQVMQRGKGIKLEGARLKDPATGALDPGQTIVENLAAAVGTSSVGMLHFAAPGDTSWEVWNCFVALEDQGGGNNDKVSWGATFTRTGASTTAAKP